MTKRISFIFFLFTVICMAMNILPGTAAAAEYIATELPTASAETRALIEPDANSINVAEGGTYTLTVSGTSGTVTWTSGNTAVATVNASGVVTGVKAGTTSITASVGGSVYQSFTVYVRIADGMYYISRNGFRLGTTGQVAQGTRVTLRSPSSAGFEQLKQLWKITYLSKGYYSIRPMYKLDMGLHATSNYADIVPISTNDTLNDVGLANSWGIEYVNGGYVFKYVNTGSMALYPISAYDGAPVITSTYSPGASFFIWTIQKVTGISNQMVLIDPATGASVANTTRYLDPGEQIDPDITPAYVSASSNDQSITWSSSSASNVGVNSSTGEITAKNPGGSATITATHYHNGVGYQTQYTVHVKSVPNGTYFIRNRAYDKYMQIEKSDAINGFLSSGATMEQWNYDGEAYQKWSISWVGNGYYSIISVQSGKALSIASGQAGSTNVPLVQETYTGADRQLWKIIATNGYYVFKAKSAVGNSNDLVISAGHGSPNDSNGVTIEQCQYTNDNRYNDEWFICSIVDIGMSTDDYVGIKERRRGSYFYANTFYNQLPYLMDFGPFTRTHHYNNETSFTATKEDFDSHGAMNNQIDFMIFIGHGHSAQAAQSGDRPWGNHIQYSQSINGDTCYTDVCETYAGHPELIDPFCLYMSEVHFGSSNSDLRWVWMYTCNFLNSKETFEQYHDTVPINDNQYVTDANLKEMMTGAHIVMGYATQSYLCLPNVNAFSTYLSNGMPIIDAFFRAGSDGEGTGKVNGGTDDHHIQKVMYIPQARYETIFSPQIHYSYTTSNVQIYTHDIQEPY